MSIKLYSAYERTALTVELLRIYLFMEHDTVSYIADAAADLQKCYTAIVICDPDCAWLQEIRLQHLSNNAHIVNPF